MEMMEQTKLHQKRIIQLSKARMTESVNKNRISKVVASDIAYFRSETFKIFQWKYFLNISCFNFATKLSFRNYPILVSASLTPRAQTFNIIDQATFICHRRTPSSISVQNEHRSWKTGKREIV